MRSLFLSGLIAASLALAANGAMAANIQARTPAKAAPAAHARVAAQYRYPAGRYAYQQQSYGSGQSYGFGQPFGFGEPQVNPQQIIASLLNSPLVAPYLKQYGGRVRVTRGGSGGGYDPTFDTPAAASPPDTSIQDMLNNQAEQQAIDSANETNAEDASMAAAAAQNAADSAAMTQQIENNGGL